MKITNGNDNDALYDGNHAAWNRVAAYHLCVLFVNDLQVAVCIVCQAGGDVVVTWVGAMVVVAWIFLWWVILSTRLRIL